MNLKQNEKGEYEIEFDTQHGGVGAVGLGTSTKATAEMLAGACKARELEAVAKITNLTHEVVTQIIAGRDFKLGQAIDLWKHAAEKRMVLAQNTISTNENLLRDWANSCYPPTQSVGSIAAEDIASYINRGQMHRTSALRILAAIRNLFSFLVNEGYVLRNPAAKGMVRVNYNNFTHGEKEPAIKSVFTDNELGRLLSGARGSFWEAAITIALETGLRLSDICQLEREGITDFRVIVWTDKTNTRINLPMGDVLRGCLERLSCPSGRYLFPDQRAYIIDPRRRAQLSTQFSRLCRRVGLDGKKTFHCLRHTYASRRLNKDGLTVEAISGELGHRGTDVTHTYLHPSDTGARATACSC